MSRKLLSTVVSLFVGLVFLSGVAVAQDAPPQCKVTYPADFSPVTGLVTISATATDDYPPLSMVRLSVNGTNLSPVTVNPPNYVFQWNTASGVIDKTYEVNVNAYDSSMQEAGDKVTVIVNNGNNQGSVSGTISYGGSQVGSIYACLSQDPTFKIEGEGGPDYFVIISPTNGSFNLQYVRPGTWYLLAIMMTGTSNLKKTDPWGVYGNLATPIPITVTTGNSNIGTVTMIDGSDMNPNPWYHDSTAPKVQGQLNEWDSGRYSAGFWVNASANVRAVSVSGYGLSNVISLSTRGYSDEGGTIYYNWGDNGNGPKWVTAPPTPQTYTFTFYEPTTTYAKTAQLTGFVMQWPTLVTPLNNANIPDLTPTFTWAAVPSANSYEIYVYEQMGMYSRDVWNMRNIPKTQTSIVYNSDGQGSPLLNAKQYYWYVRATDINGNQATPNNRSFYTPGGSAQRGFNGQVIYGGTEGGQLHVIAGIGNPPSPPVPLGSGWEVARQDLSSMSGPYTINVTQNNGNYYLLAFKDIDYNNQFDQNEPAAVRGPFSVYDNMLYQDLNLGGATLSGGKIEGYINYNETTRMTGNLVVMCSTAVPGPGVSPVRIIKLNSPSYPFYYVLDGLEGGNYYVFAFIDSNPTAGNNMYDNGLEPAGYYGNYNTMQFYSLNVIYNQSTTGISVDIKNPSGGTSGTNTVKGNVNFSGASSNNRLFVRIGYGDSMSIYEQKGQMERYGAGPYEFNNLPDGTNYRLQAYLDYNNNWTCDVNEPQYYSPSFISLSGGMTQNVEIQLTQPVVVESTITVTIRGKVYEMNGSSEVPVGGAVVYFQDTGGFNDNDPGNDVLISSVMSNSIFNTGEYESDRYNFEIPSVKVRTSETANYNYNFKVTKPGYKTQYGGQSFWANDAGQIRYVYLMQMQAKPVITIANFNIIPASKIISPDNDGIDDQARISFKYSVQDTQQWGNGANMWLVIDADKDGLFESENNVFVDINGRRFIKWDFQNNRPDPNVYINYSNPDYSKLKGPLSSDQEQQYRSMYDPSVQRHINDSELGYENSNYVSYVEMIWEGRNNSGNPFQPGTYVAKLMIDEQNMFDESDGLTYSTTFAITVQVKAIKGRVLDSASNPISGAKINAYGPYGGMAFTDANGYYVVSGIRDGDFYSIEASADTYASYRIENIQFPKGSTELVVSTITLTKGVKLSGTITMPNPPKAGTVVDSWGNVQSELWGQVEASRRDGPGWSNQQVRIPLSNQIVSQATCYYEIYLAQGQYEFRVYVPGYTSANQQVTMGSVAQVINVPLQKSAIVRGTINLPAGAITQAFFDELMMTKGRNDLWFNINVQSLDQRDNRGCGINFMRYDVLGGRTSGQFMLDTLIPNTSYTLRIESDGIFASKQFDVFSGSGDTTLPQAFTMDFGATLTGSVRMINDVSSMIRQDSYYSGMSGFDPTGKIRLRIGIQSLDDYSWNGTEMWISTQSFPSVSTYSIRGLTSGKYRIKLENAGSVDISPVDTTVTVSTSVAQNIAPFEIQLKRPTGILTGKINNISGRTINFSSSTFMLLIAYPGSDSGGPAPVKITPDGLGSASYWADNLPTGEAIIWANEYAQVPSQEAGYFGVPSGKAGTIWAIANTQSGATTYLDLDLKSASTIQMRVYASSTAIDNIYQVMTSTSLRSDMGGPVGFMRGQSLFMRNFANDMTAESIANYGNMMKMKSVLTVGETVSFGSEMVSEMQDQKSISVNGLISGKTTSYIDFIAPGLEEGIYYIYPLVGTGIKTSGQQTMYGYQEGPYVKYAFASVPVEQNIRLGNQETKSVSFTLSEGVSITGSITRPQTGTESLQVQLKKLNGEDVAKYDISFTTTNQYNTSGSFKFDKVSPGSYILIVWTQNYKVVSKELTVGFDNLTVPTIQLSKGATMIGYLKDDNGKAIISGVLVQCQSYPFKEGSYRDTDMQGVSISTETLTAGKFTFRNLPGGTYIITVSAKQDATVAYMTFTKAGITVPDSQTEFDAGTIKLGNGTTISGTIFGTNRALIANVRVLAYPQNVQQRTGIKLEAASDTNGKFIIRGINPDIKLWEMIVNARQEDPTKQSEIEKMYGKVIVSNVDTSNEQTKDDLEVTLPLANATVKGKVLAANLIMPFRVEGIDVDEFPAALILLQSAKDLSTGDPMAGIKMITNPDGSFTVKGIVPGAYTLKVFAKGYATYTKQVTVEAGDNDAGNITLTSGLTVSGSIRTQVGNKISNSDASIVVAATRDFAKIVFGSLVVNPVTQEIDRYAIIGLEPNIQYYIALVKPETNKIMVDPAYVMVTDTDVVKDIIYRLFPPQFEARGYKTKLPKVILPFITDFKNVNANLLPADALGNVDVFFIKAFATQPLRETSIANVVSTKTADGFLVVLSEAEQKFPDNRNEIAVAYFTVNADKLRDNGDNGGNFVLNFKGSNSDGIVGETDYRFYLGGDGKSEKIINPLIGGNVDLGEGEGGGDQSGLEMPSGVQIEDDPNTPENESDMCMSSGTNISVTKYTPEGAAAAASYMPNGRSKALFRKMADSTNYPGQLVSSIYDLQVRLISGPLATIAQDKPVTVKLQISTVTLAEAEDDIKVYHQDSSGNWVPETGSVAFEWSNFLINVGVTHLSKFAAFVVHGTVVPPVVPSADLSNVKVYPNPYKMGSGGIYDSNGLIFDKLTTRAKIKIYNIAGELVRTIDEDEIGNTGMYTWNCKNSKDSGQVVASGVYVYFITNPDPDATGVTKKVGKVAIIK